MDILINKRKRIVACPCCEYKMLGERNDWEICVVCKREDDCLQADEPD
ncbi:CPCC family cysteine-rich protein [Niallia circulans]|nr:CPCC family cysteine-rich protein [Niallia circulans]